jgi:hypothetical protein
MSKSILIVLTVLLIAETASAGTHTHPGAKVSLEIPSSWKVTTEKGMLIGRSADKTVALLFWVVDTSDAEKALSTLDKELGGKVTQIKWPGAPKKFEKNGLSGIRNAGSAKVDGKDAVVLIGLAGGKKEKKGVIVFGMIETAQAKAHGAELEAIFESLKYNP